MRSIDTLLRADLDEAAGAVLVAQRDDAIDARAEAKTMARRDVGARADNDAMRYGGGEVIGIDVAARGRPASPSPTRVASVA